MEKILKTIDALKMPSLGSADANIPGTISSAVVAASDAVKTKKKERINHCRAVADAVCNPSVQGLTDYGKILESVTEVLFQLCNDPDSDIRLVASDCLNRIARTLKDPLQPKFHMEVYREIRKNQSPRSLKTALNIFAFVCPMIRPQKCRAFLSSLLPCFAQISKRTEELLYENIATSLTEIFKYLGPFAHESEIKILCKDFIVNLESNSAIIRRASATILVAVSQFSKNPSVSLAQLLSKTTDLLMPSLMEKNVSVIIGVLLCLRQCIPRIYEEIKNGHLGQQSAEQDATVSNLIQVYEMCMILCNHDDHNVITTSLETLQQLFTSPAEPVIIKLLSPSGIQNSLDEKNWNMLQIQTPPTETSIDNLAFCPDETSNLLESDLDVPKFRSIISSDINNEVKDGFDPDQSMSSSSRRDSDLFIIEGTLSDVGSTDGLHHSDDENPENTRSESKVVLQTFPELQIGSLYEQNIPIYYCSRFLAYNFLLSGQKGVIRPDGEVRVSVKVLATNCIVNLVAICPDVLKLTLSHVLVDAGSEGQQTIEDVDIYSSHSDPLLRGTVYVLIGTFIQSMLIKGLGGPPPPDVDFESLATILRDGLGDSSNVGVKCAISGVNACVHTLITSPALVQLGQRLLGDVLKTSTNPYWLVKVDLIELLSYVDWGNLDNVDELQDKTLVLFLDFLSDEDSRVRASSTSAIIRYVKKYGTRDKDSWGPYQLFCNECVANKVNVHRSATSNKTRKGCFNCDVPNSVEMTKLLESVLNKLLQSLRKSDNKFAMAGHYATLSQISELFEPRHFKQVWGYSPGVCSVHLMLSICMDTLRSSPAVYDLTVHQSVLCLAGNLFLACEFFKPGSEKDNKLPQVEVHPFRCHNMQVSIYGIQLLQHCLAVMKLYQNVIESINSTSPLRKQSNSPVISPVKKFSQKLEAEKKAQESESEKKSKGLSFSETVCPNHSKKLHDSVVQSWRIFKSSLDPVVASKFSSVLLVAVNTIHKLFSCIRPDYHAMTNLIEEILNVSSVLFYLCPVPIMQNIREMLNCIFSLYDPDVKTDLVERMDSKGDLEDFLNFAQTYENTLVEYRSKEKPMSKLVSDKSSLGGYIRQFESSVVTALRIYTTTSDPEIQIEVLGLLVQLIKGHVNYGLVDSSQVFLGFVTKQILLLEEGHLRNPELLAEEIFRFLTFLTHEYNSLKRFIDVSKILSLCHGLVSATGNSSSLVPPAAAALKFIVNDLFILRGTTSHTNQEKKEYEAQRDAVFLMVKQLACRSEGLPIMWVLLKGRKLSNEAKWLEESEILAKEIMIGLKESRLKIKSMPEFNDLAALLYSFHVSSVPNEDALLSLLNDQFHQTIQAEEPFLHWCITVNSYWLLLTKRIHDMPNGQLMNGAISSLLLNLLQKAFSDLSSTFKNSQTSAFIIDQIGVFLKVSAYLLKSDNCENMRKDLRSQECVSGFLIIANSCSVFSIMDSRVRLWLVDFLTSILYPKTVIWEVLLHPSNCFSERVKSQCVIKIIHAINEGDVPTLEEWIINNQSKTILNSIDHPEVVLFIRRLSTYRMEQILDQITILLDSSVDMRLSRNILSYLERVADSFLCETAVLAVKLLKLIDVRFLSLEASQFCYYVLSHIRTRKLLLSSKDREFLRDYYSDPAFINKYPRLVTLAHKVLCEDLSGISQNHSSRDGCSLVLQLCSKDFCESEGIALVKMLSNMKYAQITSILNTTTFNMSILHYCFRHLRRCYHLGMATAGDVSDLLTSQKRPGFIEKWPLAVAAVEFILDTLDTWECFVSGSEQENYSDSLLENSSLQANICHMWAALTEMLLLKTSAIKLGGSEDKECCNNFIPTGIFTMSFQYMAAKCKSSVAIPFEDLGVFLKFAAVAVCDSSFLSFFDVRDNPPHIFACVTSIGSILRKLIQDLRINFSFTHSETDAFSGMNDECIVVLNEFHYLMEFVQNAEVSANLGPGIFIGLRNVVSGLGRCELVNGWILVSHLGWRPQALSKANIFPAIQQIPLEILRNEADMLLKYISKLNLLGVASKIQFEENWVIFLSVINLYVDETFQLQIVTTGLRALSMMLQQSIRIKWSLTCVSEEMRNASVKIDLTMEDVEPELCRRIGIRQLTLNSQREFENEHGIDVNSCIRFLTDLYSQWLQNPQGKMPLHLLSEVIQSIVIMAEYFEDISQYAWMYETLIEIQKSLDKEDEMLWPHLMYGIFFSAAKLTLDTDAVSNLTSTLETALVHPSANIANVGIKCALVFLQSHPDCAPMINIVAQYVLKATQLDEMTNDSETHCLKVWKLLLFIWIHGPTEGITTVPDIEQDTLRNILTVLSPLNKVYVSVRLLVLKALRLKIEIGGMKQDIKKLVAKVTLETLRTPNVCIFFQAVKLYLTMFYDDFKDFMDKTDLDPEILMPMAERADVLFQYLRSKTKCHNQIVSKILPLVIADFLPPSEILNRVIAEFLSPTQTCPELVAPAVAQVFEKAKRRPKEFAVVREWILASLPNFLANANVSRAMWSLTVFFVGVSSTPEVFCLLPFAQLRRNSTQVNELFLHAAIDFYLTLDEKKKTAFKKLLHEEKPYGELLGVLEKIDLTRDKWEIDRLGERLSSDT